jgi:hypothetical protein
VFFCDTQTKGRSEVADRHADAYRVKVSNRGGLSAKERIRRELARLGIGRE